MALSPMLQQYFAIKEQHKDQILFYRLGDFYEMFFDDATLASKELDLTLTGRDCGLEERAPMCGVPYHSCESYIQRLIEKGYKVAICEQMEDPATAKGVVKREVIRVVTPGTILESNMLDESKNNFLCSIFLYKKKAGICFADISTGEIHVTELSEKPIQEKLINEIGQFSPSEVIANSDIQKLPGFASFVTERMNAMLSFREEEQYEPQACEKSILVHFQKASLSELGLAEKPLAVCALGSLLFYLKETQKTGLERILTLHFYREDQYMHLDPTTRRNLELTQTMRTQDKRGSLLWILDKTKTAMGKRLLRKYIDQPLLQVAAITRRQNAVSELYNQTIKRMELSEQLSHIYDLERLMTKVVYASASARDLRSLSDTAAYLPDIKKQLVDCKSQLLRELYEHLDTLDDLKEQIDTHIVDDPPLGIKDGGIIRSGVNEEIDSLQDILDHSTEYLARIETRERDRTGIKNLKIGYNRVFGYYLEVSKSNIPLVPSDYIRKQTLTTGERYITEELKQLESKILTARERITALEFAVFDELRKNVAENLHRIQDVAGSIATLDVLVSFAEVAFQNEYTMPDVDMGDAIEIKQGRHPVVEQMLHGAPFVGNDTLLDCKDNQVAIITGPNMAGKSTFMRQTAIIVLMAQIGSFVPAKSAHIGVVDGIFTRVGATDDLSLGQSTFMVEMSEVAYILKNATSKSLILLDEIGRGTSTFDGMSIARAVVEYIANPKNLGAKTLFATHYHELIALEESCSGVKNYNVAVKKHGDNITFLRRIVRGGADDSYGIEVSKLAGIPQPVIERAKEVLQQLESENRSSSIYSPKVISTENDQISFMNVQSDAIRLKLQNLDVNTLSPIEAIQILYELTQML